MITIIAEQFRHWIVGMAILYLTIVAAGATLLTLVIWFGRTYWKFRQPRKVLCPKTDREEVVEIDAFPAACSAILHRQSRHVVGCSGRQTASDCDESCVPQLVK